jgi:tetratricopeptide (TPR) repeat protein
MMATTEQHIQLLEKRLADQPTSPLFAQLASYYLEMGRTQEALSVCERGLAQHPFYPTGHLIKGRVLATLRMNAEARRELEFVQEFFPGNKTIADLIARMPVDEDVDVLSQPTKQWPQAPEPEVASEAFAPEQSEAETPFASQTPEPETPTVEAEEASPFDQLQTSTGFETPTPSMEETPTEDAFAQLTPTETPVTDSFAATTEEESPFGALEMLNQPAAAEETPSAFGEATETPQGAESPFAALESPATGTPFGSETEEVSSPFGSVEETPTQPETGSESPFGEVASLSEEESFEQYAARMRGELAGQEDSIGLDDYLGNVATEMIQPLPETSSERPAIAEEVEPENVAPEKTEIEEIAEKLQSAKKITPVINIAERAPRPASEAETPASTGFVTPTLAEIYAKQGWFDDAIKAYKTLMVTKPSDREKFEKRIAELEEQKAQQSG